MHRSRTGTAAFVLLAALALPTARALAQAPGYAEITSPVAGEALQGLITIEGSADHPSFLRYDLSFAHDSNPTDTWFPLGEPVATRARQATLGLWDTSQITPGIYQLRLRVFLDSGAVLEDVAGGLRIGLPAAGPISTGAAPTPTRPPVRPSPTPILAPPPSEPEREGDPVLTSLTIGAFMAAAFLLILAAYLPLRRSLALWAGNLRMRRVLRQDLRRRQRERGGR